MTTAWIDPYSRNLRLPHREYEQKPTMAILRPLWRMETYIELWADEPDEKLSRQAFALIADHRDDLDETALTELVVTVCETSTETAYLQLIGVGRTMWASAVAEYVDALRALAYAPVEAVAS